MKANTNIGDHKRVTIYNPCLSCHVSNCWKTDANKKTEQYGNGTRIYVRIPPYTGIKNSELPFQMNELNGRHQIAAKRPVQGIHNHSQTVSTALPAPTSDEQVLVRSQAPCRHKYFCAELHQ